MSNILITGATGFIGSNLVRSLVKKKHNITILTRKNSNLWRLEDITLHFEVKRIDLLRFTKLRQEIREIKPDIVYHCATYGLHPSQKDLKTIMNTSVIASANFMKALVEYNDLHRFVNLGSSHEYGSKLRKIRETDTTLPVTAYGIAKLAQTHLTRYFTLMNRLPATTLRLFTTYGKFEEPGHLISDIMFALVKRKALKIISPKTTRDFIYIQDIIMALHKAAEIKHVEGEIFNIGSGVKYSTLEILNFVKKIDDFNINVIFNHEKQTTADRVSVNGSANIEKAEKLLRWKPAFSIKQGLLETYNWYKNNIRLYSDPQR